MKKICITYPVHESTIAELGLVEGSVAVTEDARYLYEPEIGLNQSVDQAGDPSLKELLRVVQSFVPSVLIVGSNAVPGWIISAWREAAGREKRLMIIRRGTDTRAIDTGTAAKQRVFVAHLPGINSPYVARHMLGFLRLQDARENDRIAVIGAGNIGSVIAQNAVSAGLEVRIISPSLMNPATRVSALVRRSLDPQRTKVPGSVLEALQGARYVAVAVPWFDARGLPNAHMIRTRDIQALAECPTVVSASVPGIFTPGALSLMNIMARDRQITVRIDTSRKHVKEERENYPFLDLAHDQAFADPECQIKLDTAMLDIALDRLVADGVAAGLFAVCSTA
jgi:hypothetical protein